MRKILLDREEPDSSEIKSRQNFDLILRKYRGYRDYLRSPWFYGTVGLASLLSILMMTFELI